MFLKCLILQMALIFSLCSQSFQLHKRPFVQEMKTSVIIPCCGKHFQFIPSLLEYYAQLSTLPNEIVISLSNVEHLEKEQIDEVENHFWPFQLKIIRHAGKKSAGQNRNIACENSSGDIILCQDADDIPHPQRVEIIKYIFENYEIDHLIHKWANSDYCFLPYDLNKLKILRCKTYAQADSHHFIHNGNICITREVAKKIKWEGTFSVGEDVRFNKKVYQLFNNNAVLLAPLLIYRKELSSFKKDSLKSLNYN